MYNSRMSTETVEIVLKYNGYWKEIPRTMRKKYEAAWNKTFDVEVDRTSYIELAHDIGHVLPWVVGQALDLSYPMPGSNPKTYRPITTDKEYQTLMRVIISQIQRIMRMFTTMRVQPGMSIRKIHTSTWEESSILCSSSRFACDSLQLRRTPGCFFRRVTVKG